MLLKSVIQSFLALLVLTCSICQNALAHTSIDPPSVTEGTQSQNHIVINHGCGDQAVIGTSYVIPDGVSSTVNVDGNPYNGPLSDFIQNWGNSIEIYQDRSLFSEQDHKFDDKGNVVGFWLGGGRSLSPHLKGRILFVSGAVLFVPESCAKVVRFVFAGADICKITGIDDLIAENVVNLWTPAVGSKFDGTPGGHSFDSPSVFTFNRDLATNPLPESCGAGQQVTVKPSAAQIDRDMPVIFNGIQVWPQP